MVIPTARTTRILSPTTHGVTFGPEDGACPGAVGGTGLGVGRVYRHGHEADERAAVSNRLQGQCLGRRVLDDCSDSAQRFLLDVTGFHEEAHVAGQIRVWRWANRQRFGPGAERPDTQWL